MYWNATNEMTRIINNLICDARNKKHILSLNKLNIEE